MSSTEDFRVITFNDILRVAHRPGLHAMALDDSALLEMIEMLRTGDGGELMRWPLGGMVQAVVDAEATARIGAGLHERSEA